MDTVVALSGGRLVGTHYGFYSTIVGIGILVGNVAIGALVQIARDRDLPGLAWVVLVGIGVLCAAGAGGQSARNGHLQDGAIRQQATRPSDPDGVPRSQPPAPEQGPYTTQYGETTCSLSLRRGAGYRARDARHGYSVRLWSLTSMPNSTGGARRIRVITLRCSPKAAKPATTKVAVRIPDDTDATVRPQPLAGWTVEVTKRKVDPPPRLRRRHAGDRGRRHGDPGPRPVVRASQQGQFAQFGALCRPLPDADSLALPTTQTSSPTASVPVRSEPASGGEKPKFPVPTATIAKPASSVLPIVAWSALSPRRRPWYCGLRNRPPRVGPPCQFAGGRATDTLPVNQQATVG